MRGPYIAVHSCVLPALFAYDVALDYLYDVHNEVRTKVDLALLLCTMYEYDVPWMYLCTQ